MSKTTKIADSDIAIEPGQPIAIRFSGGRQGKSEAGVYEFWTIFNNTDKPITGRSLQGTDPGERFRRMQGARGYEQYWKVAATAIAIRPATQEEVLTWLRTHGDDALFAESCNRREDLESIAHDRRISVSIICNPAEVQTELARTGDSLSLFRD